MGALTPGGDGLLVYIIALDALTTAAVRADLNRAVVRRLRPLGPGGARSRRGQRPDVLLFDTTRTYVTVELAVAWATWGDGFLIVGMDPRRPYARIWRWPGVIELVEMRPGFLARYLPALARP